MSHSNTACAVAVSCVFEETSYLNVYVSPSIGRNSEAYTAPRIVPLSGDDSLSEYSTFPLWIIVSVPDAKVPPLSVYVSE